MKSKSWHLTIPSIGRSFLCNSLALAAIIMAHQCLGADAVYLLEKGIYTEETKGEISNASQIYREIVEDPSAERSLVAQAQLRLGLCELKLGHKPQAIAALDRLTQEFPDQEKLLALIENQMPRLLDEIVKQIQQSYIQEVDRGELLQTAIRAILGKLDAQNSLLRPDDLAYLAADEVKQMNESLGQKIAGIGAVLKFDTNTQQIVVETPLPGSPALKAGLRPGDRIIEVDGAKNLHLATAVRMLRGDPGSMVKLGIQHAGSGDLTQIDLVREAVQLATVTGNRYKPDHTWDFMFDHQQKIGYVRLAELGRQSPREMEAALNELKAQGLRALVLDLRDNPGGLLDSAVAVADLFLESGLILTVKGRGPEQTYEAKAPGTFSGFPMAVVVNSKTASAAEIVAAALQDHQRAVVVGERTYGQALVRTIVPLKASSGALKLPVAAYYRPSGKTMNRYPTSKDSDDWGVSPDPGCEVVVTPEEARRYMENRREANRIGGARSLDPEFRDRPLERALDWLAEKLKP